MIEACLICPIPGDSNTGGILAVALLVGAGVIWLIRGLKKLKK